MNYNSPTDMARAVVLLAGLLACCAEVAHSMSVEGTARWLAWPRSLVTGHEAKEARHQRRAPKTVLQRIDNVVSLGLVYAKLPR